MADVFFSYSHKDEALRDRLEVHLTMLKREGIIETWHDRRITAGDEFAGVIDARLESADLILLLVSADFLNSNYCFDVEMKRALERHAAGEARVIPIILRPCDWHSAPFGRLLAAPKDGKPIASWPDLDEAFVDVVRQLRAALPSAARPVTPHAPRASAPAQVVASPRSSNLRLKRTFTEVDRDRFLESGFDFLAKFFETSVAELEARNPGVEARFKRIDANKFTGSIYRQGKAMARCKIALGGMFGKGISFSYNDSPSDNAINESLSVDNDDQSLFFKPLGMAQLGRNERKNLTFEGASEYYWSLFIEPLQR
jgi:TIR domain